MARKMGSTAAGPPQPASFRNSAAAAPVAFWKYASFFAVGLYLLFEVYGPAVRGAFVFDDLFLPYSKLRADSLPFTAWFGVRPLLGLSYWIDYNLWGRNTFPFHVNNLLLHFGSATLLFFVFRKLLALEATPEPRSTILSAFGAALFLFHPAQTEVAAYVASRSEALSLFFFLVAFCVFLYRPSTSIDWRTSLLVMLFFVCAIGSKEPALTLPAVLLLTDYFWNPGFSFGGIRRNYRLYIPVVVAGTLGGILLYRYVSSDPMIGFHIEGLRPATYFLTQCRAVFGYLALFAFPHSQTIDHDFPLSHSPVEHGAVFALAGLLLLLTAALLFRKAVPFAAYGFFAFLILLSPTSSFIPITDVFVERRLYLPFFALVLILFEPLRRVRATSVQLTAGLAALICVAAFVTWQRAHVWSDPLSLFQDAAAKSPAKARVHIGYANALYHQGRCPEAIREYGAATRLQTTDYVLYFNLAAAYVCAKELDNAVSVLDHSIELKPQANSYTMLGKILGEQGRLDLSLVALNAALKLDSNFTPAVAYRGALYAAQGKTQYAYDDFQRALELDPQNEIAQKGLAQLNGLR